MIYTKKYKKKKNKTKHNIKNNYKNQTYKIKGGMFAAAARGISSKLSGLGSKKLTNITSGLTSKLSGLGSKKLTNITSGISELSGSASKKLTNSTSGISGKFDDLSQTFTKRPIQLESNQAVESNQVVAPTPVEETKTTTLSFIDKVLTNLLKLNSYIRNPIIKEINKSVLKRIYGNKKYFLNALNIKPNKIYSKKLIEQMTVYIMLCKLIKLYYNPIIIKPRLIINESFNIDDIDMIAHYMNIRKKLYKIPTNTNHTKELLVLLSTSKY